MIARWICRLGLALGISVIGMERIHAGPPAPAPTTPAAASPAVPSVPPDSASPSAVFRKLLHATPAERNAWLEVRPPQIRELVTAKLGEFSRLTPIERELRLEVAELEFFLTPLLRAAPEDRSRLLARIPMQKRSLIDLRLKVWDSLGPDARKELLESQQSLAYFVRSERVDSQRLTDTLGTVPPPVRAEVEAQFARWAALQPEERARKTALFERFYDLSSAERARTLRQLSDDERQRMKEAMAQLDALEPQEREHCLQAARQFAALSTAERAEFMANAARWKAMKPTEQAAWKALVDHLDLAVLNRPPIPPSISLPRVAATNR